MTSSDGLKLEARLDAADQPRAGLVFCHPHPQMGGTMNAPLLEAVTHHLVGSGWVVLRFNFRGIGASEGEPGTGEAEVGDARGALAFLRGRASGRPLAIAGWSFGAAVAIRTAAIDDTLRACVAIAPAVTEKPGVTAGLPHPSQLGLRVALLVVAGANDQQVSPEACRTWAEQAGGRYVEMAGANHFFWAKYDDLARVIATFLQAHV